MKETRYYLIDTHKVSDDIDYVNCTDEEFITMCEEQGNIYSAEGFQEAFNTENINTAIHQLRVIV